MPRGVTAVKDWCFTNDGKKREVSQNAQRGYG